MILFYFLIPLLINIAALAATIKLEQSGLIRKFWVKRLAVLTGVEIALFCAGQLFVNWKLSLGDKFCFSWPLLLAMTLLLTLGFAVPKQSALRERIPRIQRSLRGLGIACVVLFVLELAVFSIRSYGDGYLITPLQFTTANSLNPDKVSVTDSGVIINGTGDGTCGVEFVSDIPANYSNLHLKFTGSDDDFSIVVGMKDANFSIDYQDVADKRCSAKNGGSMDFVIEPYETLHAVRLNFKNVTGLVRVTQAYLTTALAYHFSYLRYFVLLGLCTLIIVIFSFRLWEVPIAGNSRKKRAVLVLATFICLLPVLKMAVPDRQLIDYPFPEGSMNSRAVYEQLFDAFQKGQANLDVTVDETLLSMDETEMYDNSARNEAGAKTIWDRSFYDGKYYCYFGVTPVLLCYYPCYWITGMLPTMNMVCQWLAMLAVVSLMWAVMEMVRTFRPNASFLLAILGGMATVSTCGVYVWLTFSDMYNVALLSVLAFLGLTLALGFRAYRQSPGVKRCLLFFATGISFVLTVASRPTTALIALLLAPAFIHVLCNKQTTVRHRVCAASVFLVPVIAGGCAIMYYNYIRFGSPFEFGASYQMTVSSIQANKLTLRLLPYALFQYFLQLPDITGNFPYLRVNYLAFPNYAHYIYNEGVLGVLCYPHLLVGMGAVPSILRHNKKDSVKRATLLLGVAIPMLLAWVDFCVGGLNIRYLCDLLPALSFVAVLVILEAVSRLQEVFPEIRGRLHTCAAIILIAGGIVGLLLLMTQERGVLHNDYPEILQKLETFLIFWI